MTCVGWANGLASRKHPISSQTCSVFHLLIIGQWTPLTCKVTIFQYKIIHNFLYTNCILYKMKKSRSPHCPFCTNVDQTVSHLFVSCPCASSFWSEFTKWYQSISKKTLNHSKNEVLYGVFNDWSSCSTLNHLILIVKYFVYCQALNSIKFQFAHSINLVNYKIEIEHQIARKSNKLNAFL